MTIGPGEQAAGLDGPGCIRASDADREQVIDALKTAFVHGRLTKDELALRAGQALVSRTYAELGAATAGIPPPRLYRPPLRPAAPAPPPARKPVNRRAVAWAAACVLMSPAVGAAFFTYYGGFVVVFVFAFLGLTVTSTT